MAMGFQHHGTPSGAPDGQPAAGHALFGDQIRELQAGIAGAGLDVFITEPLPSDSRFFDLPNLIYSPHISGEMPDYELRATEVFCENLKRYLDGKPFLHEVDKGKGY